VTTVPKCQLDAEQGGAKYVDQPVVLDGNIITSRYWMDNAHLMRAFLQALPR
jgi:protease I